LGNNNNKQPIQAVTKTQLGQPLLGNATNATTTGAGNATNMTTGGGTEGGGGGEILGGIL
jgi:hypothetical protein